MWNPTEHPCWYWSLKIRRISWRLTGWIGFIPIKPIKEIIKENYQRLRRNNLSGSRAFKKEAGQNLKPERPGIVKWFSITVPIGTLLFHVLSIRKSGCIKQRSAYLVKPEVKTPSAKDKVVKRADRFSVQKRLGRFFGLEIKFGENLYEFWCRNRCAWYISKYRSQITGCVNREIEFGKYFREQQSPDKRL